MYSYKNHMNCFQGRLTMLKFENWKNLVNTDGVKLCTYRTPNGSWLGWVESGDETFGFVDTDWNLIPYDC